jgi:hypothetical protein
MLDKIRQMIKNLVGKILKAKSGDKIPYWLYAVLYWKSYESWRNPSAERRWKKKI